MKYTENGLQIGLDELRRMLELAEHGVKCGFMENCIYIKGGEKPKIIQNCVYADCNPTDHTYDVH